MDWGSIPHDSKLYGNVRCGWDTLEMVDEAFRSRLRNIIPSTHRKRYFDGLIPRKKMRSIVIIVYLARFIV